MNQKDNIVIYQTKGGEIKLKEDVKNETIWANRMQMVDIFNVNPQAISKHIQNIYKEKELVKKATSSKMELVQNESGRVVKRKIDYYNLEMLISVGYRINSIKGTKFRQWATKILKQHISEGYTINSERIEKNHQAFLKTVEDIKLLAKNNKQILTIDVLELIKSFSYTWFSLDSYDKNNFPQKGTEKEFKITAEEFLTDLAKLKKDLVDKKEATEIFAQEKTKGNIEGIFGNIFQGLFGRDAYVTIEEKAAHLLYFIIKNHPFTDGNKRSGAFAFIWFLQKADFNFKNKISPETLVVLTILIAESNPKEKEKMIGIILLLLNFKK